MKNRALSRDFLLLFAGYSKLP